MSRVVKLEELCIPDQIGKYGIPAVAEEFSEDKVRYLRITDIDDYGNLLENDKKSVSSPEIEKYILKEGDIVFARTGNSTGRTYFHEEKNGELAFAGFLIKFSLDESKVNPKYLKYFTLSKPYKQWVANLSSGSTRGNINAKTFADCPIILPPRAQQDYLVRVFSSLEEKIQTNNQINQELEVMAKTLYDYWFVQFDFPDQNGKPYKSSGGKMIYNSELKREIPEGWGVEKLKDKLSVSRGISYKTENIKDNIGIPMINLASIGISRNYKSSGLKFFNGEYSKEKIVSGGDLLIACTDLTRNADIVGSPIIVPFDEQKYLFSMDLAKIDSKVDYINKYYLYSTLRTEHYHNYIKKWASGTNVLHLNIDGMGWYSIAIPPMNLQEEYSKIILNFSKKTNNNIQQNQELTQLRDWLLPMLMNGQVKVE